MAKQAFLLFLVFLIIFGLLHAIVEARRSFDHEVGVEHLEDHLVTAIAGWHYCPDELQDCHLEPACAGGEGCIEGKCDDGEDCIEENKCYYAGYCVCTTEFDTGDQLVDPNDNVPVFEDPHCVTDYGQ